MVLTNMKFRIQDEEHSKAIQECLFKLGFRWHTNKQKVANLTMPFIYADTEDLMISHHNMLDYFNNHENKETTLEELQAMLNQPKKQPHVHAELIKAWADGAEIQLFDKGTWVDTKDPYWCAPLKYRIKPELTDFEKFKVEIGDVWYQPSSKEYHIVSYTASDKSYVGNVRVEAINTTTRLKIGISAMNNSNWQLVFRRGVINKL